MQGRVKHLVVDSGAFIKNATVNDYADNIYSVNGAVKEIRDKATRQRLQFLPYTLILKDPDPENFKYVAEFSKKTGDYASLSATDLKIIALTYQLEKELVGTEHLNKEPRCEVTVKGSGCQQPLHGFYYPQDDGDDVTNDEGFSEKGSVVEDGSQHVELNLEECHDDKHQIGDCIETGSGEPDGDSTEDAAFHKQIPIQEEIPNDDIQIENHDETGSSDEGDSVDVNLSNDEEIQREGDGGSEIDEDSWITPGNLAEVQQKMGNLTVDSNIDSVVACVTTDFAIQNVLLQMGLHVVSVDGMLIRRAKVFILRCFACYRTTSNMTSKFCSNCGNATLKRVAVSVNDDGTKKIHINFRRPINIRGTKYSLPTPQGGKHAQNPHICADQQFPHNRPAKAALKEFDVFSPEYCVAQSPFIVHDIYSRAGQLGIHGAPQQKHGRRNPNARSKRTGNKKNKK